MRRGCGKSTLGGNFRGTADLPFVLRLVMDFSDGGDLLDYVMSRGGLSEFPVQDGAFSF